MVANLCFAVLDPRASTTTTTTTTTQAEPVTPRDLTTYETSVYRNMKDSRVFHKSPTDIELTAAEKGGVTPSLPIDHDRYLTFSHTVGGEYTMQYPNLFRVDEKTIMEKYSTIGILKRGADG